MCKTLILLLFCLFSTAVQAQLVDGYYLETPQGELYEFYDNAQHKIRLAPEMLVPFSGISRFSFAYNYTEALLIEYNESGKQALKETLNQLQGKNIALVMQGKVVHQVIINGLPEDMKIYANFEKHHLLIYKLIRIYEFIKTGRFPPVETKNDLITKQEYTAFDHKLISLEYPKTWQIDIDESAYILRCTENRTLRLQVHHANKGIPFTEILTLFSQNHRGESTHAAPFSLNGLKGKYFSQVQYHAGKSWIDYDYFFKYNGLTYHLSFVVQRDQDLAKHTQIKNYFLNSIRIR